MSKNNNNKKIKKIRLNKVCRSCLSERGHLKEVHSTKILTMIETISTVQVSKNDNLPKYICTSCIQQISKFYNFKKKIERNDRILKNYIKQLKTAKVLKYSDILHRAVNDAEIESITNEDVHKRSVIEEIESIEDIPLIHRIKLDITRRESKVVEDDEEDDVEEIILNKIPSKSELELIDEKSKNILTPIFTDGPPPLVPLVDTKTIKIETLENVTTVKNLPVNAPPLIPIKPLSTIDPVSIVNTLGDTEDPPVELKLSCTVCNEEFSSVLALKQHKKFNCQSTGLQCNICKKDFKERSRLIGHLKGHMVVKDYACKICGKCYPNPSTFRVHMRTHTGERPFKCQICHKGFVRWSGVMGHMKTHSSDKPFKCETCGKGFKISSNLERHKILHAGILPYCCNFCGKTFSQSDNLRLHIRTYHTNERPYLCNECGKGFVSSTRLNRHMWVHTGYKPYKCNECPKAYSNSNDLKNHERTHSKNVSDADKPHGCQYCDMRFFHLCRLAKHMKIHDRPFGCGECVKTFSSEAILNKHMVNKHGSNFEEQVNLPVKVEEVFIEYQ